MDEFRRRMLDPESPPPEVGVPSVLPPAPRRDPATGRLELIAPATLARWADAIVRHPTPRRARIESVRHQQAVAARLGFEAAAKLRRGEATDALAQAHDAVHYANRARHLLATVWERTDPFEEIPPDGVVAYCLGIHTIYVPPDWSVAQVRAAAQGFDAREYLFAECRICRVRLEVGGDFYVFRPPTPVALPHDEH